MSAHNLFLEPPHIDAWDYLPEVEARKTAGVKLTSPPSYWGDEITQNLLRDHPYIPAERVVVNFKKRDDAGGNALGFIGVTGAPTASIPVVIVNRELKPLDIIIIRSGSPEQSEVGGEATDDRVLPLNENTFSQTMDAGEIGTPIHSTDVKSTNWSEDGSALRLPFRGRTVIASHMGITEDQKTAFATLLKDKSVLAGLSCRGGGDEQAWLNGYGIKTAGGPGLSVEDVVNAWLSAPPPGDAIRAKMAGAEIRRAEIKVATSMPQEASPREFLAASICCAGGEFKSAAAFDAIDLTNPINGLSRWLVFEDGSYCHAPEKVARLQDTDEGELCRAIVEKLATRSLQRGAILSFVTTEGGQTHLTSPAKLASIASNDDNGSVLLSMADHLGRTFPVTLSRGVKVALLDEGTGSWVLPINTEVLQLNGDTESTPLTCDKVASLLESSLPDTIVGVDGQYSLTIGGEIFQGASQVGEEKIARILDDWFINGDELLEMVKESHYIRFDSNLGAVQDAITKQASVYSEYPQVTRAIVADIALSLDKAVKLAAAIGDPAGADALLGAGFLTEDNIAEFSGLSGQFEETTQQLARLLLAIRLGFPGDESATVVAMKSLQRVSEHLRAAAQSVGD